MEYLPSLRHLQYFVAVIENKTFSAAAAACNVTQPTLSGALLDLESHLGQKIFDRTTRDLRPTRFGEDLILPARDLIARAEHITDMARGHHRPLCGNLRLGVIPTIAPYVLPALLPALGKNFTELDLQLKEDQTARLLDALNRRDIDVILMAFPFNTPGCDQMPLWSEDFVLALPGKTGLHARRASLDDLQRHNIMLLEDGHCLRDHALAACRLQLQAQRKTFGATSLPTLIQMVQHGFGATLLPAMAIDAKSVPPGITIQRFSDPQPTRQIGLVWRKDSPRSAEYQMLAKFIVKTIGPR